VFFFEHSTKKFFVECSKKNTRQKTSLSSARRKTLANHLTLGKEPDSGGDYWVF
jgi:hypothetical protein